jgi:hypothetical protein
MEANGQPHAPIALSTGKETPIHIEEGPPSIRLLQLIPHIWYQHSDINVTHNVYQQPKWLYCIFMCLYKTVMITWRAPEIQPNFTRYLKEIHSPTHSCILHMNIFIFITGLSLILLWWMGDHIFAILTICIRWQISISFSVPKYYLLNHSLKFGFLKWVAITQTNLIYPTYWPP